MKAHIKKDDSKKSIHFPAGTGPYHGHPIRLTIGMIVKNEEKTLDRCLSSLKPLMEAVESELIITDTGSTDRTMEIAKKYTDHIIHFQWCDDFAAARNTGVEAARGEWFLFLDADEWFENTDELIEFFNSGECDQYGSAAYKIRNYVDFEGKNYSDFHALRISRMFKEICFQNAVHENLIRAVPTKYLNDYVNHYGYVYHSTAEKNQKYSRNRKLLETELQREPENLKVYCQLSRQYVQDDANLAEKYCIRGLQVEQKNSNRIWHLALRQILARAYFNEKKYEKLIRLVEQTFREDSKTEVVWLDFYGLAQLAASAIGEYERSVDFAQDYLRVYEQYRAGGLDTDLTLVIIPVFNQPKHREQVLCFLGDAYLHLERYDQTEKVLNELDFSNKKSVERGILLACRLCTETDDWSKLPEFYHAVLSALEPEYQGTVEKSMESSLPDDPENRAAAFRAIAAIESEDDAYVHLCRLRSAEEGQDGEAIKRELDWFFRWNRDWDPVLFDVIYYGMRDKRNLMPLFLNIETEDVKYYVSQMHKWHSDFKEVMKNYVESFSYNNVTGLRWTICIRRDLLSEEYMEETDNEKIQFFEEFARETARYVRMLYCPEMLSKERVSVLPRAHRFGYFMGCAFSARKKADNVSYLSNLRLAVHSYPTMKRPISTLLERFEREDQQKQKKAEEFNALALQAKCNIRTLIAQNRMEEAGRFTAQLAALMPDDPDVVKFRSLLCQ
ncbi:MAG: glycosyltransferase family 2 protein [Oscillospiraceae bacterium]|jgi:glycosyltransferase involved in cell wall biosynthesis|nr:glycosyltransferase family 2 protein [Oscillospiraceae bacterium]